MPWWSAPNSSGMYLHQDMGSDGDRNRKVLNYTIFLKFWKIKVQI